MRWYAGSDHAGLPLKQHLVEFLRRLGDEVEDVGTHDAASVDYPAFGAEVGRRVVAGPDAYAHNDANVIALGARVVGPGVAESAVAAFRDAAFEGGRHQRRIDQLGELERTGGS